MSEPIFIEQAPSEGREHPVQPGVTIGREGCDIVFADPDVSRRHAAIQVVSGEVSIEDLGSTNGTYVNGDRIDARRRLGDGDKVEIGSIVLILRAPAAATRLVDRPTGATKLSQSTTVRPAAEPPAAEPSAPEPSAPEPPAPPPRAPEPVAAEPPAPEPPAGSPDRRGDVPVPDFQPSAIRRVVPGAGVPTPFAPSTPSLRKGSAATRMGATIMAGIVVALTTAGVLIYYITEPFK
jgi:pSer/pThr/pTyr-binding forkhead associated (FHA) protein